MAKAFDPRAKAKRQKIIAGVLGLVLVAVLVYQAPTIMGVFGGSSSTASESTPPPPPAPVPTPAVPGTATPAAAATGGSAVLVDTDPAPAPAEGQLVTFDRFESKDPFAQQMEEKPDGAASKPSVPVDTDAKGEDPEAGGTFAPAPTPAAPAASREATISVNGVEHEVEVGDSFPKNDPIFKLVSLRGGTAKIGIVGGGYANGAPTIALKRGGKPVTLLNTADGTTYVLRFVG
jgi:hypothetical protein